MNQYLLLRDNKQTGPYTAEELKAKGLKAYDLVWLEGRSAAWRYPGEIDELKSFAPAVEEQPFDRFYKKPSEQTTGKQITSSATTVAANTVNAQQEQPVQQQQSEQAVARHIYVTMPVTAKQTVKEEAKPVTQTKQTNTVTENKTQKKAAAASSYIVSQEDDELNSSMLAGYQSRKKEDDEINNSFLSDYESRKAAFKSQKSGAAVATQAAKTEVAEKKKDSFSYALPSRKKESIDLKALLAGSARFLQDNKNLTRTLVACVLILGGVVIGLIINSSHRTTDTQALESLVKEIREQQNNKNATPAATEKEQKDNTQQPAATENQEAHPSITDQVSAPSPSYSAGRYNQPSQQTIARHAVLKKENSTTSSPIAGKPEVIATSNTSTTPVETTPAVMEQPKEKPAVNQEVLERARKTIYDQVHLEASAFKVGLLGGVSDLDITVTNSSAYPLDQVAVEIKYYGLEKKLVKSQTLVFSNVPAGKRRTLEVPRTNRGITIDYTVVGINSKVLGLAQTGY